MTDTAPRTELEARQDRVGRNTALLAAGELFARLLGAASAALIARAFGARAFGQITLAMAVVFYFQLAGTFGLDVVGTRRIASLSGDDLKRSAGSVIGVRLVTGALAFALLAATAGVAFSRTVALLLAVYGLSCVVNAFLLDWYFIGTGRTAHVALARILRQVVFFAGVAAVVANDAPLVWVAASWVASDVAAAGYLLMRASNDPGRLDISLRTGPRPTLLKSCVPIAAGGLMVAVIYRAGTLVLAASRTETEVGHYGAAFFLIMGAIMLVQAFGLSLFPQMCRHAGRADYRQLRRTLRTGLRFAAGLILPGAVLGIIVARPVITIIYGEEYLPAVPALRVLLAATVLIAINTVLGRALWATERAGKYLKVVVVQGGVALATALALVGPLGGVGAALSLLAGETAGVVGYGWSLRHVMRLPEAEAFPFAEHRRAA